MIPDIKELNFPQYATLSQADITQNEMGEFVISAQVLIDGNIKPDFSYDWEIEFNGERYIHPLRSPQALKDNTSVNSKIDLIFHHWLVYELKREYFVQLASIKAGVVIPDKYITPLGLNIYDFITAFQGVLDYYYKGAIKIELNPDAVYSQDKAFLNISYSYIWEVLQELYKVFGVRWYIKGNTIKVGYPAPEISHVFEYGYIKGLLSLERQVQDANIRNILLGRGGSTNLPKYYFKNAPENSKYASDPDAIPELENYYFTELRGKTFRDYIQGWKTNPNRETHNGAIAIDTYDEVRGEIDFAYKKGHEDEHFDPIEFVKDDVSIAKYGRLTGGLNNNEEIYPSIQNISLDGIGLVNEVVAVEPVLSDDVEQSVLDNSIFSNRNDIVYTHTIAFGEYVNVGYGKAREFFEVKEGFRGTVTWNESLKVIKDEWGSYVDATKDIDYEVEDVKISIIHCETQQHYDNGVNLPEGSYYMTATCYIKNIYRGAGYNQNLYVTLTIFNIKLTQGVFSDIGEEWKPTFDVWIKNIWQTEKLATETEQAYADRVWLPILGTEGKEAAVTFSSGWLSSSSDWSFTVVKGGYAYDTSKTIDGVSSHWKLTLKKSDAELKATGKYIPNMGMQAGGGDTFFFTEIDMPHQYVLFGEQRVDEWKYKALEETKDIQPTWVSKFDKVRINKLESGDTDLLIKSLSVGALIRFADKRFIEGEIVRYIQTITYKYSDKALPDVEIVLSSKAPIVDNPVERLQGQVDLISAQIARPNASFVNQLRQIFDSIYLRKDGVEDISSSPTSFKSVVKSDNFRAGMIGGAGWGVYRDMNGYTVAEFDHVKARLGFQANNFVINETEHIGGRQVYSAAGMVVTKVVENRNTYSCYFDQKGGSVANLFVVGDVAYCQKFDPQNNDIKFYKRAVTSKADDYIELSKSTSYGDGIPSVGDVIIHYGNYTDANRQFVIIRDVIGGGYERMLCNLDSVYSEGKEYYFAGRIEGGSPRWFVGDNEGEYAEWKDGELNVKGRLKVGSSLGGATVVDGGLVTAETISLGSDTGVKAGVTGTGASDTDIRMWAGATFEQREKAPYRVLQDGTLFASKGVFSGFIKTGTTIIDNDNYLNYLESDDFGNAEKFWKFNADKCSPCIIIKVSNYSYIATLSLPSLQINDALVGVSPLELESLRGFIGQSIIIYYQGAGKGLYLRFCDSSGEYKIINGGDATKPALGMGEFIKLNCKLGSKYSSSYDKFVEYIYWEQEVKGSMIATTQIN